MKRIFLFLILTACCICGYSAQPANSYEALSPADREVLNNAIKLVDGGMSEAAIPDFDMLITKYPDNYLVMYERLYNLMMLKRYDEVIKSAKKLLKQKEASERAYQMIGNAYRFSGNLKEAVKVYEKGLKQFPGSGALNFEIGNIAFYDEDYDKALTYYNQGIVGDPNYVYNYYNAADLYFNSTNFKVWG